MSRFSLWTFSVAMAVLTASTGFGQNYPNRPIRIVTTGVGGDGDFMSRLIAQGISGPLGQPVIVDNRPSGVILGNIVAKAPPDGYNLLLWGTAIWTLPLLRDDVPFEAERDFVPIMLISRGPNVLVAHPSVGVNSVKELIALAKAKPGALNYSTGSTGGSGNLSWELFKSLTGVNMVRIPYKSGSQEMIDLVSGQIHFSFISTGAAAPHIESRRLRALAVTSAQPSVLAPGLPTVAASGVPGFDAAATNGMWAPIRTPAAIVNRLHQEMARVLSQPDVKQKFFDAGAEVVASTPEQFAATIKSETARWGKVIKDAGIRAD